MMCVIPHFIRHFYLCMYLHINLYAWLNYAFPKKKTTKKWRHWWLCIAYRLAECIPKTNLFILLFVASQLIISIRFGLFLFCFICISFSFRLWPLLMFYNSHRFLDSHKQNGFWIGILRLNELIKHLYVPYSKHLLTKARNC